MKLYVRAFVTGLLSLRPLGCSLAASLQEDPQLWLPTNTGPATNTDPRTKPEDLYKYMDGVASVTTIDGGSNLNVETIPFGYKDIPNKIPMTADCHFPIASNSKLYTTVAIYQLHEQGLLDVDADIATMISREDFDNFGFPRSLFRKKFCPRVGGGMYPATWRRCEKITLRNLLSMSSGIYPPLNCDAPENAPNQCNRDPYFVNRGSIGRTVGTFLLKPLMFRPGTKYHYSNPNFILAAYFVEKYSGMTFRDYLETHIFSRIGLKHTYFDFFNQGLRLDAQRVGQYIRYYDNETEELISVGADVLQLDLGVASGTGGIISTVDDQLTFWYALFNKTTGGSPLLSSAASQEAILSPWTFVAKQPFHYPNGTLVTAWGYYTQGCGIICEEKDCPNGPKWIQYTGGTLTVHTANLLDYESFKMVQVWTTTLIAMTDRHSYQTAFDSQTGLYLSFVQKWLDPRFYNPMVLAWKKMLPGEQEMEEGGGGATPYRFHNDTHDKEVDL